MPLAAYAELLRRWQQRRRRRLGRPRPGAEPGAAAAARAWPSPGVALGARRPASPPGPDYDRRELAERCHVRRGDVGRRGRQGPAPGAGALLLPRRGGHLPAARARPRRRWPSSARRRATVYEQIRAEGAALLADLVEGTGLAPGEAQAGAGRARPGRPGHQRHPGRAARRARLRAAGGASRRERASTLGAAARRAAAARPPAPADAPPAARGAPARPRWSSQATVAAAPDVAGWLGRWSLVHRPSLLGKALPDEERSPRQARQLLARWGVVDQGGARAGGRGAALGRALPGPGPARGCAARCGGATSSRGCPALQFALPEVVEQAAGRRAPSCAAPGPGELEPTVLERGRPGAALRHRRVRRAAALPARRRRSAVASGRRRAGRGHGGLGGGGRGRARPPGARRRPARARPLVGAARARAPQGRALGGEPVLASAGRAAARSGRLRARVRRDGLGRRARRLGPTGARRRR